MDRERFDSLVAKATGDLPQAFLNMLDNVDIVVEDYPTTAQLKGEQNWGKTKRCLDSRRNVAAIRD